MKGERSRAPILRSPGLGPAQEEANMRMRQNNETVKQVEMNLKLTA